MIFAFAEPSTAPLDAASAAPPNAATTATTATSAMPPSRFETVPAPAMVTPFEWIEGFTLREQHSPPQTNGRSDLREPT